MSNSVQPHRWQPTRLPHPWDSPDKNTGVGCHLLLQCMKEKSESEVAQSCPTLSDPMDCSLSDSSIHGIFQARVLEWVAIAFSSWLLLQAIWSSFLSPGLLLPFNSIFSLSVFQPISSCYPLLFFPHCFLFLYCLKKNYSWHFVQEANRFYLGRVEQGGFCRS